MSGTKVNTDTADHSPKSRALWWMDQKKVVRTYAKEHRVEMIHSPEVFHRHFFSSTGARDKTKILEASTFHSLLLCLLIIVLFFSAGFPNMSFFDKLPCSL